MSGDSTAAHGDARHGTEIVCFQSDCPSKQGDRIVGAVAFPLSIGGMTSQTELICVRPQMITLVRPVRLMARAAALFGNRRVNVLLLFLQFSPLLMTRTTERSGCLVQVLRKGTGMRIVTGNACVVLRKDPMGMFGRSNPFLNVLMTDRAERPASIFNQDYLVPSGCFMAGVTLFFLVRWMGETVEKVRPGRHMRTVTTHTV